MMPLALLLGALLPVLAQQKPQMPNFQAPPGHTVKVESITTRYNFSGFNRVVKIPLNPFIWPDGSIPSEYKRSPDVKFATKEASSLYSTWRKVLPSFEEPKRIIVQSFKGAEGGTIMYVEWERPLPADARKAICRVLFKADEKDYTKDTKDDLIVTDTWVIIWSFNKPLSKIKEAHQKHCFQALSSEAQIWEQNNPEAAKKLREQQAAKK